MKADYFDMASEYAKQARKSQAQKRRPNTERKIQSALKQMADLHVGKYPDLEMLFFSIPNEAIAPAKKNPQTGDWYSPGGAILNALGRKKGVWDLHLAVPRGGFCGMFLETKAPRGRLSQEQIDFGRQAVAAGHYCVVYDKWETGWQHLVDYLENRIFHALHEGYVDTRR